MTPEDRSGQGHAVRGLAYGKAKNFPSVTHENSKTVLSDRKVDMASIALLVFHGLSAHNPAMAGSRVQISPPQPILRFPIQFDCRLLSRRLVIPVSA